MEILKVDKIDYEIKEIRCTNRWCDNEIYRTYKPEYIGNIVTDGKIWILFYTRLSAFYLDKETSEFIEWAINSRDKIIDEQMKRIKQLEAEDKPQSESENPILNSAAVRDFVDREITKIEEDVLPSTKIPIDDLTQLSKRFTLPEILLLIKEGII